MTELRNAARKSNVQSLVDTVDGDGNTIGSKTTIRGSLMKLLEHRVFPSGSHPDRARTGTETVSGSI